MTSRSLLKLRTVIVVFFLLSLALVGPGCFNSKVPAFYGRVVVPRAQEFRWSDGGLPQTFDPAFAAAPPDTDVVRAIFEGLTDYDARTLAPIPAVATRWEESHGGLVWTFYLRDNARWSNGEFVTANDFVKSWQRTLSIGDLAPHTELLRNIRGARPTQTPPETSSPSNTKSKRASKAAGKQPNKASDNEFGVQAIGERVLRVHLERPDMNFPALVSHPVFRPVKIESEKPFPGRIGPSRLISNGAFSLAKAESERVLLERAQNYWGRENIGLERVEFVGLKDAESALKAYYDGQLDAVSNAAFEPLALKLLIPFKDFRRATYGALTYYSFNIDHAPFDDVRVREALAIAIDRDRISQDDLGGATEAAKKFLPPALAASGGPVVSHSEWLEEDVQRARALLADAGYSGGKGFPKIRLLINRNEQQRLVAQSIASMWRNALNVETEILVKSWEEYTLAISSGDYDVARRGLVMQTTDELTNIRMIFEKETAPVNEQTRPSEGSSQVSQSREPRLIESESEALSELRAFPIYFASSYALVKPYISGFETNVLDAPTLRTVKVEANWREEQ